MRPIDRISLPPLSPRELRRLRWNLSALRVQVKLLRLAFLLRKANFNPLQLRIPQGNEGAGQWTDDPRWGGEGSNAAIHARVAAATDFGQLVQELFLGGVRRCIYHFGGPAYIMPWPHTKHVGCPTILHQSTVFYFGSLINDNHW
jgi:hypothetical protein